MHCVRMLIDHRGSDMAGSMPCHKLLPINPLDPDVRVETVQCSMLVETSGYSMIRVTDLSGDHDQQMMDPSWQPENGEYSVSKIGTHQYVALVVNNTCKLAKTIAESGCFLTSAIPRGEFETEWTVVGQTSGHVHVLMNRLRESGFDIRFLSSHAYSADSILTPKQEDILKYAYDRGYYEIPKRVKVDDIAKGVGCTKSTVNVMLRSAENKIITNYIVSGKKSVSGK